MKNSLKNSKNRQNDFILGRFIKITNENNYLHMAEVEVFDNNNNNNIALNKYTEQSSTTLDSKSSLAVDGNKSGNWKNNSVSFTGFKGWWWVDLE